MYEDVAGFEELAATNGKLYLPKLDAGDYQLVEIVAPRGYKLDATPVIFTISPNQTTALTGTKTNEVNVGSVEISKVDEYDQTPLTGAVFELRNASGQVLLSGLPTDAQGKLVIPNLKAGKYQLVETTAPADYVLSQNPLEFEIVDDGVVVQKTFTNKLIPGDVTLTKIESGRPSNKLEGAQFRVLDANKTPILSGLSTDVNGELHVPDLRPGKYFFEETRAPNGYIIKTRQTEFEILIGQVTTVTVENLRYSGGGGGGGGGGNPEPEPESEPEPEPKPEKPDRPDRPDRPDPDEPEKKPEIPGVPTQPGKPEEPTTPTEPVDPTPVTPTPETPTPVTPVEPVPVTPTEPATPTKPVEKVEEPVGNVKVPEGGTTSIGKQPEHGTVTIDANGKWVYTPNNGSKQKDTFSVIVRDKDGNEEEILYEVDGDVPTGGIHPDKAAAGTGKVLPNTGEESHLLLQLLGVGLIVLGAWLFRRTRTTRNMQ